MGTGIDYDVLKRAGAATADGFIAVTNGDNRNIMAALIAKRMFKIKRIVARIYDPPRGQVYRELGVLTVCPTTVGARLIRDVLIEAPWETQTFDLGKLSSVSVNVGRADAGKRVGEIQETGKIRICAVRRGDRDVMIATEDLVLEAGDELSAVVAPDVISRFAQRFGAPERPKVSA